MIDLTIAVSLKGYLGAETLMTHSLYRKIDQITHIGPTFGAPPLMQTVVTFVLLNGFLILAPHLNRMTPNFDLRRSKKDSVV